MSTWAEASACLLQERFSLALVAVSSILENVADIVADICRDHPDTHLILLADQDSIGELRLAVRAGARHPGETDRSRRGGPRRAFALGAGQALEA